MSVHRFNRGARYGRAIAALDIAGKSLAEAESALDLLSKDERDLLAKAIDIAAGLSQRMTERQEKEARR